MMLTRIVFNARREDPDCACAKEYDEAQDPDFELI